MRMDDTSSILLPEQKKKNKITDSLIQLLTFSPTTTWAAVISFSRNIPNFSFGILFFLFFGLSPMSSTAPGARGNETSCVTTRKEEENNLRVRKTGTRWEKTRSLSSLVPR